MDQLAFRARMLGMPIRRAGKEHTVEISSTHTSRVPRYATSHKEQSTSVRIAKNRHSQEPSLH